MDIRSAEFVTSATRPGQYPPADFPEIAFSGRSNVGKSSMINALVNRKSLVKTSSKPGRTQLINFFLVNRSLSLVDLPGYGYAKVPISVKKAWRPMIETYLSTRKSLRAVVLIMDIRRFPGQEERQLIQWLAHFNIACILTLTKADKFSKNKQIQQRRKIADALTVDGNELILFSARTRMGRERLWSAVSERLLPHP